MRAAGGIGQRAIALEVTFQQFAIVALLIPAALEREAQLKFRQELAAGGSDLRRNGRAVFCAPLADLFRQRNQLLIPGADLTVA